MTAVVQMAEDPLEKKLRSALRRDKYVVGPALQAVRRDQEANCASEYYAVEHLRRLLRWECRTVYPSQVKVLCKDVHGPGCRECKTCHFCRQKTAEPKTNCRCANIRNAVGGPGRGTWCGTCLQIRMGENITEVINNPEWRCPGCRQICNCSAPRCDRGSKGLNPTNQLHHEARDYGYKSVAHYIILTALDQKGIVHPMAEISEDSRVLQRNASYARTAQQQPADAVPGAAQTVAALRAQAAERRQAAELRRRELLAAVAAVLPPVANPQLELAMGELGMVPAAGSSIEQTYDEDDDDDIAGSSMQLSSGFVGSGLQGRNAATPFASAASGDRRPSSAGNRQQQEQQPAGANSNRPAGHAGLPSAQAAGLAGLTSPRPGAGKLSGAGLQTGLRSNSTHSTTPSPMPMHRQSQQALPELGMLRGTGVLGFSSFADTWRSKVASPMPGEAQGRAAGLQDAEAGSRLTAAAPESGATTAPSPLQRQQGQQPQQHGPRHSVQQQQQGGQQSMQQTAQHQPPPLDSFQQQRLQRLQAAEEHFGPNDLPGGDAPGYTGDSTGWYGNQLRNRPSSAGPNRQATAGRQPKISGWLSAAGLSQAFSARRSSAARRPASIGRSAAVTAAADTARAVDARAGTPLGTSPSGTSPTGAAGTAPAAAAAAAAGAFKPASAIRSAVAAGIAGESPAKRIRLDTPVSPDAAAAADHSAVDVRWSADPGLQQFTTPPAAAGAADDEAEQPVQHQQQQQHQQSPHQQQQPGARSSAAMPNVVIRPPDNLNESEAQHYARRVRRAAVIQAAMQRRGLVANPAAEGGSAAKHLRQASNDLEQRTFADWDRPLVVNQFAESEVKRAAAQADLTKLRNGVEALLVLAETLPLMDVRFAVVGRLDGSAGAFLDFQQSDPIARATLLDAWHKLMTTLISRGNPGTALEHASTAAAATVAALAPQQTTAAEQAVQKAICNSIEDVQSGLECMLELVNSILGWLGAFQEEFELLFKLQHTPQDLLGPISVGHIRWSSAHLPQHQQSAAAAAWHLQQQEQLRQEEVRQQRLLELATLEMADSNMLKSLLTYVCELCPRLPRKVASALLGGKQLGCILDMKLLWPAEVCKQALVTVKALAAAAAPDLQEAGRWFIEEPAHMKQLLAAAQQQHQQQKHQQQNQQTVPGLQEIVQQQIALFQQVVYSQIDAAQRAAELSSLAQAVKQHLLLPLEQLTAAEFAARENWVKDNLLPKQPAAGQAPQQQQQVTAALPWYLQRNGAGPQSGQPALASAGLAGAAGRVPAAAQLPSVEQQEAQQQHSFNLGVLKLEALALVYALQLQAGAASWPLMEKQLVAPASSLNQLLEAFQNLQLRRFVIVTAAEISKHAPSVVRWQQQPQQQHWQPAGLPVSNQVLLPAEWMLKLWLRAMLDLPNRGCRRTAAQLTLALLNTPATAPLFQFLSDAAVQYIVRYLEQDQFGQLRACWVCEVAKAMLAGVHVAAGAAAGVAAGALRCQDLRDMLSGLPQVLWARQSELERGRQHIAVLLWQRACMPTVLSLAELVADTLTTCNSLAPGAAGTSTAAAPAPPSHAVVYDMKKALTELLGLASSWVRDAVAAVCGRAGGSCSSGGVTGAAGAAADSVVVDPQEAMVLICQSSALAELQKYLAVIVHLAGVGCKLDDISTDQWPADVSSSSSSSARSLRKVWADVTTMQRSHLQQQRTGGYQQQQHGAAGQALPVPCLSELILALVQLPSAGDSLQPSEKALFSYTAAALAACGGLTPQATAAGDAAAVPESAAAPAVPEGYSSPGLLHLMLGTHIRVILDSSVDRNTASAHSKAVNALHLVRAVLSQPGVLQDYGQRLLLPCLARPLVRLMGAAAANPAVQYQVFQLLQQLLGDQLKEQLLQLPQQVEAGQHVGWNGCLRSMTPLQPSKLQQLLQLLLTASIRAGIGAVGATISADSAAKTADALRASEERQRQRLLQQQPAEQLSQAGAPAAPAAAAGLCHSQYLFHLQPADTQAVELQLQNSITGSPSVISAQLQAALQAADARLSSKGSFKHGAERPEDFSLTLAKAAIAYCAKLMSLRGYAQDQAMKAMPCFVFMLRGGGLAAAPLLDTAAQLVAHVPEARRDAWIRRLADVRSMVERQRQEQQHKQMAPPPKRPPGPGQQPGAQGPQQPRQQHIQQQQQQRRAAAGLPAAANACSSQAASVAGGGRRQQSCDHQQGSQHKRPRIAVPAESDVYSAAGGRGASCSVVPSQQHSQQTRPQPPSQPQQMQQRPQQQPAVSAAAPAMSACRPPAGRTVATPPAGPVPAAAATAELAAVSDADDEGEISSSARRGSGAPQQQQQMSSGKQALQQQLDLQQQQPHMLMHSQQQQPSHSQQLQPPTDKQTSQQQQLPPSQPRRLSSTSQRHSSGSAQDSGQQASQQPSATKQQAKQSQKYVIMGSLDKAIEKGGQQLVLHMSTYSKARQKYMTGSVHLLLSGRLADCARALLRQSRIKPGVMLGLSDALLQNPKLGIYVPSDTSKLYLDPQASTTSNKASTPAATAAAGKENVASAEVTAAAAVNSDLAAGSAGQVAVDAERSSPPTGIGCPADAEVISAAQASGLLRSSSTSWWPRHVAEHDKLRSGYEQQTQQMSQQATQARPMKGPAGAAAPGAAQAGVDDSQAMQQRSPARPATSGFVDSQATIKYITQPTEM